MEVQQRSRPTNQHRQYLLDPKTGPTLGELSVPEVEEYLLEVEPSPTVFRVEPNWFREPTVLGIGDSATGRTAQRLVVKRRVADERIFVDVYSRVDVATGHTSGKTE